MRWQVLRELVACRYERAGRIGGPRRRSAKQTTTKVACGPLNQQYGEKESQQGKGQQGRMPAAVKRKEPVRLYTAQAYLLSSSFCLLFLNSPELAAG